MKPALEDLTPKQIVEELDKYIVGQTKAKKAVAVALRNRVRRRKLSPEMQDEVTPKNIIMIGPTGVGKTETARRISKLTGAPFIKVEASKYTEVGYVGRDVESMVRDLMGVGISMVRAEMREGVREEALRRTEEALLDLLLPQLRGGNKAGDAPTSVAATDSVAGTREKFRQMLRAGELDQRMVEVEVSSGGGFPAIEIFSGAGIESMDLNLGGMGNLGSIFGRGRKKKRVSVRQAAEILLAEETDKLIDDDRVAEIARDRVQQMGIIFIDEIDKVASREGRSGVDVSREGVQRDILPIVEGSQVNTRYGMIDTSHILFIAAGAFHMSKPSDLIPELQGRFPIRVELDALTKEDFVRILTQPQNALIKQYTELLKTEGVHLSFDQGAVERLAELAAEVNSRSENIGARRLSTIMELLLEEVSFHAPELEGQNIPVTADYVDERLQNVVDDGDLSRYIL